MTASEFVAMAATVAIPVTCIGLSTLGWRNGGSRMQLLTFTLLGVLMTFITFAMVARIVDLEPFTTMFVVLTIGLSTGTVIIGKKRLNLT